MIHSFMIQYNFYNFVNDKNKTKQPSFYETNGKVMKLDLSPDVK